MDHSTQGRWCIPCILKCKPFSLGQEASRAKEKQGALQVRRANELATLLHRNIMWLNMWNQPPLNQGVAPRPLNWKCLHQSIVSLSIVYQTATRWSTNENRCTDKLRQLSVRNINKKISCRDKKLEDAQSQLSFLQEGETDKIVRLENNLRISRGCRAKSSEFIQCKQTLTWSSVWHGTTEIVSDKDWKWFWCSE